MDLVDPWLQFSVFEDGNGIAGQVRSHGQNKCENIRSTDEAPPHLFSVTLPHARTLVVILRSSAPASAPYRFGNEFLLSALLLKDVDQSRVRSMSLVLRPDRLRVLIESKKRKLCL